MDTSANVACWSNEHMTYVTASILVLAPYYMTAIIAKFITQGQAATVLEDRVHLVVSFQFKFFLAVVASMFGQCFPLVIVLSTEVVVI